MSARCSPTLPRPSVPRRRATLGAVLGLLALGCESPAGPPALEESAPPPAALPTAAQSLPVPPGSVGCGAAMTHATGARYQICWPAQWNGIFIVYAHGYVSEFEELAIPAEAAALAAFVGAQGFAFASTSYRINGLAIPEGVMDMVDLATLARTEAVSLFGEIGPVPVLVTGTARGPGFVASPSR